MERAESLREENETLIREADENAALVMQHKMRADDLVKENAALKERLEKAVELPRIIHPNKSEWHIQYQYESGIIDSDIRFSIEAAEARFKELKGESDE